MIPPTELVEPAAWVESAVVPLGGTGVLRAVVVAGEGGPRFRVCPRVDCLTVTTDWTGSLSSVPDDQFIQLNGQAAFTANTLRSVAVNVDAATFTWDITTGIKVAFLAQVHSLADLGTYAFSGLTLGAATTGRMIAVAVHASTNVDVAFATAKLNATPCTKLVAVHENLANGTPGAMFLCDPGNAVTGAVEVSLSGGPPVRVGVALWSLVGLQGAAPHDVATYDGANPGSVVVDVAAGGAVLVGLSQNNAAGAVVTWGNAAEQYAWVMPEGTFTLMAGGYHYAPQGGTVTVTTDSSGAGTLNRLFPVSFR
ncbi:MAG: hypothetical protein HY904_24930 [Deltaproteobacteria bacterium]|nr:hypothetical protein [Deltaproteobacteria bacterium]